VPEVLCLADSGWEVLRDTPKKPVSGGTHGYDNAAPDMAALFIASGPAFKARGQIPAFDNTAIEPMLRDVLGLPQGSSRDGMNTIFVTLRK
jgi:predicted AlkP superfamily pyrophosphatase or phosphodiesterase